MALRNALLAEDEANRTGQAARRFKDFRYATLDSWSRRRRDVGKAEWTRDEANPRFVVTSLAKSRAGARDLCETIDCAFGDMDNRIKECQGDLFDDRTSSSTMRANQLRLWFASIAYVLVCALRRIGLAHPVRRCHLRHDPLEAAEDRRASRRASDASGSPWRQPARRLRTGASPPPASTSPEARPPDTRRGSASRAANVGPVANEDGPAPIVGATRATTTRAGTKSSQKDAATNNSVRFRASQRLREDQRKR